MKKIIASVLAVLILFTACGKETVGTDYDFSSVIDETVRQVVNAAPSPMHDSIYGEWSVINAAICNADVPQSWFDAYYENLCAVLMDSDGVLSATKNTEYSRTIIALSAIGKNPANTAGYDLFAHYMTIDEISKQGISGVIFALIALDCKDYPLPKDSDVTREDLIDYILEKEYDGGGWAIIGDTADVDITAQVLQALAPHTDDEKVAAAVERAIALLSARQNDPPSHNEHDARADRCAKIGLHTRNAHLGKYRCECGKNGGEHRVDHPRTPLDLSFGLFLFDHEKNSKRENGGGDQLEYQIRRLTKAKDREQDGKYRA